MSSHTRVDITSEVPSKVKSFVKQLAYYIPETVNYLEVHMDHFRDGGHPTGGFELELLDPTAPRNKRLLFSVVYDATSDRWFYGGFPVAESEIRDRFLGAAEGFARRASVLRTELIRLGTQNPELQEHIRPVLASMEKESFVILDSKYLRSSIRDLEMAACVKIAAICAHEATANSNALVQQGDVNLISIDLEVELDEQGTQAMGTDFLRLELRPNERALYYRAKKLGEFSKGETITDAGKRLGKLLASWLRTL